VSRRRIVPYYDDGQVTIYCGDCRKILPSLSAETIITDPVWPNCEHIFPGINAQALLGDTLTVANVARVVVHLGNNSDPRFLSAVPARFRFLRVCYLAYAVVGYLGRILRDAEVAYVFGEAPASKPGARVLPGRSIAADVTATASNGDKGWGLRRRSSPSVDHLKHPTLRNLQHVRWLCKWFGGASVIDPFGGGGTTAVACKGLGIPCTLIEIEERFCELAVERLKQETLELQAAPIGPVPQEALPL
jgi:site-specific DNA-methyltransferase (adenine-specific)